MHVRKLGRIVSTALLALAMGSTSPPTKSADAVTPTTPAYTWVNLRDCTTLKRALPRLPAETDLVYNVQRRLLDLDRNGRCVVMDVWLERFASIPDSLSRAFEHRFYRFDGKRWVGFTSLDLVYYPYALQSVDQATVFVLAPIGADVGDDIVLGGMAPSGLVKPDTLRRRSTPGIEGSRGAIVGEAGIRTTGQGRIVDGAAGVSPSHREKADRHAFEGRPMSSRTAARQRGAGTIKHFESTLPDVIRRLLCMACGLCVTVGASAWEIATDITAAPLIRGTPAIVQFDRHWPDFSPGAPLRALRFKGPGLFSNFSKDESEKMCDQLIGRYGDLRRFQLAGVAFDRQPVYLAHLRFFLVSLELMSTLWPGPLTLQAAMADPRFPLTVAPSDRFPGFVEFRKK